MYSYFHGILKQNIIVFQMHFLACVLIYHMNKFIIRLTSSTSHQFQPFPKTIVLDKVPASIHIQMYSI